MKEGSVSNKLKVLFCSNFMISACTFGGGGVIIPVLQKKYVEDLKWIDEDEMMDMIAIAQSSPGIMAVNTSIIIGYRTAGIRGAVCSIAGSVLPPMVILSVISFIYEAFCSNYVVALLLKGMEAGVAAVMINVSINMSANVVKHKNILNDILLAAAVIASVFFGVPIIKLILVCAVISIGAAFINGYRENVRGEA